MYMIVKKKQLLFSSNETYLMWCHTSENSWTALLFCEAGFKKFTCHQIYKKLGKQILCFSNNYMLIYALLSY